MRHSPHLNDVQAELLNSKIGIYPDYPKPGILFRDVTPLLADGRLFDLVVQNMSAQFHSDYGQPPTHIAGIESRGFIFGAAMASLMGVGFVPIRKLGAKFPGTLHDESYALEYGHATLVCQEGAFKPGDLVLVVDDLIATGGSAGAAARLVARQRATVIGFSFVIELGGLRGTETLGAPAHSVLTFD